MVGSAYLKYFFGCSGFILFFVATTNYLVDPFGIYTDGEPWDVIHSRPFIGQMPNSHKAHGVELAQADILFLGTSRVAEALDPQSNALPKGRAYNLGLYGGDIYESWRFLQHASAIHCPSIVILGVDLGMFSPRSESSAENVDFSEGRLKVLSNGRSTPFYRWADALSLVSFATFRCSLETLWPSKGAPVDFKNGFEANYPRTMDGLNLAGRVLAANQKWLTAERKSIAAMGANGRNLQMEPFDAIGSFCAQHHIRLIVFVLPVHSQMLDLLTSDWNRYGNWMRILVDSLAKHRSLQWELWDFAGYNSISTEPFPGASDTYSSMHYYWENSHFQKIVGDMVLSRIFQDKGPPGFGRRVKPETVEADIARLKSEKKAWQRGVTAPP